MKIGHIVKLFSLSNWIILKQVQIIRFENQELLAEMLVEQCHANLNGGLHGGFTATLIDKMSSLTLATEKHVEQNQKPNYGNSVQLNCNYVRPARIGDMLQIRAYPSKIGSNLAYLNVEIVNKTDGKLVANGTHIKFLK